MIRYLIAIGIIVVTVGASAALFIPEYWEHRYDALIERQARVYRLDNRLIWSVIYEESYFRAWEIGGADEVGLMQITPLVAREWAKATGLKELERAAAEDVIKLLRDPERNIQAGCWYLEKLRESYRGDPAETAMTLAAYNAGPSRVTEWTFGANRSEMTEAEFIARIGIASTKNYVTNILDRYRRTPALKK
jgi:soluble lytic murein transglycosylase